MPNTIEFVYHEPNEIKPSKVLQDSIKSMEGVILVNTFDGIAEVRQVLQQAPLQKLLDFYCKFKKHSVDHSYELYRQHVRAWVRKHLAESGSKVVVPANPYAALPSPYNKLLLSVRKTYLLLGHILLRTRDGFYMNGGVETIKDQDLEHVRRELLRTTFFVLAQVLDTCHPHHIIPSEIVLLAQRIYVDVVSVFNFRYNLLYVSFDEGEWLGQFFLDLKVQKKRSLLLKIWSPIAQRAANNKVCKHNYPTAKKRRVVARPGDETHETCYIKYDPEAPHRAMPELLRLETYEKPALTNPCRLRDDACWDFVPYEETPPASVREAAEEEQPQPPITENGLANGHEDDNDDDDDDDENEDDEDDEDDEDEEDEDMETDDAESRLERYMHNLTMTRMINNINHAVDRQEQVGASDDAWQTRYMQQNVRLDLTETSVAAKKVPLFANFHKRRQSRSSCVGGDEDPLQADEEFNAKLKKHLKLLKTADVLHAARGFIGAVEAIPKIAEECIYKLSDIPQSKILYELCDCRFKYESVSDQIQTCHRCWSRFAPQVPDDDDDEDEDEDVEMEVNGEVNTPDKAVVAVVENHHHQVNGNGVGLVNGDNDDTRSQTSSSAVTAIVGCGEQAPITREEMKKFAKTFLAKHGDGVLANHDYDNFSTTSSYSTCSDDSGGYVSYESVDGNGVENGDSHKLDGDIQIDNRHLFGDLNF